MSGVDVLDVMDDVANNILIPSGGSYADELSEARAAVAELIESGKTIEAHNAAVTRAEWERFGDALARVTGDTK